MSRESLESTKYSEGFNREKEREKVLSQIDVIKYYRIVSDYDQSLTFLRLENKSRYCTLHFFCALCILAIHRSMEFRKCVKKKT